MSIPDIVQNLRELSWMTYQPELRENVAVLLKRALDALEGESDEVRHLHKAFHRNGEKTSSELLAEISGRQNDLLGSVTQRNPHIDLN